MPFNDMKINEFTERLSSGAPVPGGGSAAALCAVLSSSLCSMALSLTAGKSAFAYCEQELGESLEKAKRLSAEFLRLVDADADAFLPLSRAYAIKKDDPQRSAVMEDALLSAALVPLEVLHLCAEVLDICDFLSGNCSTLCVSDVGVAASLCRAALESSVINIRVNVRLMKNESVKESIENETRKLFETCLTRSDIIIKKVWNILK